MKALQSLSKAVPKRARYVFAGSLVVMGGFLYFIYNQANSASDISVPEVKSGAVLETSISSIQKSRPDETSVIPETSPMFKEIQKAEDQKIEAAESGQSSYITGLKFRNEERTAANNVAKEAEARPATGIDDILKKREQERRNQQKTQAQGQQAQSAQPVPIFDEDAFLKAEVDHAEHSKEKMTNEAGLMRTKASGFAAQNNFVADGKSTMADTESGSADNSYLGMATGSNTGANNNKKSSIKSGGRDLAAQIEDRRGGDAVDTKLLNRGKRYYSILNIGINTDEISPTTATVIEGGDLIGAEFISENPVRTGEKAVVMFNSMAVNGRDYQVRAIALDPESQRSGLADSVNRHIMERYLKLGIAAFVDGYADSLQDSTTTVNSDGNATTQTNGVTDSATQLKIAVGKVGEAFVPAFEDEFKRPPTVEVESNREVVIMLLDPLELVKE